MKYERITERVGEGGGELVRYKYGVDKTLGQCLVNILGRLAELEDMIESGTLVELPEKAWIVERTPFGGEEIIEYEVTSCTYVKGKLQTMVVNNECSKNRYIDIEEYHKHVSDSYLCFSYEEAVEKLEGLKVKE